MCSSVIQFAATRIIFCLKNYISSSHLISCRLFLSFFLSLLYILLSCQALTVGLDSLVKPDYLPSLLSQKLQKVSTKSPNWALDSYSYQTDRLYWIAQQAATWTIMVCACFVRTCRMDIHHHTWKCVSLICLSFILSLYFCCWQAGHFTHFLSVEAFSFTQWNPQISQKGQWLRTVGRKSEMDLQRVVRLFHQYLLSQGAIPAESS